MKSIKHLWAPALAASACAMLALSAYSQVRADLTSVFNTDAFWDGQNPSTDPGGFFDNPNRYNWCVGNFFPVAGLPANGILNSVYFTNATYQIASPTTLNTIQVDANLANPITINVPPDLYSQISFVAASADGDATLDLVVNYDSGPPDSDLGAINAPDWFNINNGTVILGNLGNVQWTGTRWQLGGGNGAAMYESFINTDPTRTITSIQITGINLGAANATSSVYAISGIKNDAAEAMLDLTSAFNSDTIWAGGDTTTDNPGTYFDPVNKESWSLSGSGIAMAGFPTNGLLVSTFHGLGSYQLGNYDADNVIQVAGAVGPISLPAFHAKKLGALAASANGDSMIGITIDYTDGTSDTGTIQAPDWYSGVSLPKVITKRDRVQLVGGNWQLHHDQTPSVFETIISVNPAKIVKDIMITGKTGTAQPNIHGINLQPASDTNDDGCVDDFDLSNVILDFGHAPLHGKSDITGPNGVPDGIVDDFDLTQVILDFALGCH